MFANSFAVIHGQNATQCVRAEMRHERWAPDYGDAVQQKGRQSVHDDPRGRKQEQNCYPAWSEQSLQRSEDLPCGAPSRPGRILQALPAGTVVVRLRCRSTRLHPPADRRSG